MTVNAVRPPPPPPTSTSVRPPPLPPPPSALEVKKNYPFSLLINTKNDLDLFIYKRGKILFWKESVLLISLDYAIEIMCMYVSTLSRNKIKLVWLEEEQLASPSDICEVICTVSNFPRYI
jgi:hypothetical protein